MAAPAHRQERIRPCMKCGALLPFSALRCGACGTAVAGAPAADERVRPCLQCGVILRFDQDPCPECGARAKGDEDRVKPCAHCGELVPFEQLYCEKCGELSVPIQSDRIAPRLELAPAPAPFARVPVLLAFAALAMGGGALLLAAFEIAH
jgi:RNA polymerase subunit RPABC4/transcription elongation factor Spt4